MITLLNKKMLARRWSLLVGVANTVYFIQANILLNYGMNMIYHMTIWPHRCTAPLHCTAALHHCRIWSTSAPYKKKTFSPSKDKNRIRVNYSNAPNSYLDAAIFSHTGEPNLSHSLITSLDDLSIYRERSHECADS